MAPNRLHVGLKEEMPGLLSGPRFCPHLPRGSPGEQAREFDRLLRFSRCMREQGIDFPDPEYSGGAGIVIEPGPDIDLTDRNVREATARCAPFGGTS